MSIKSELIFLQEAQGWARRLEDRAAAKHGTTIKEARAIVARQTQVSPGTLENLRNGRLKEPPKSAYEKLRGRMIAELEAERVVLEHEIQILRASGADPRGHEIEEAETLLARVRSLLGDR